MEYGTKGFTFIEIAVVLAIFGLLATISVPLVQRWRPGYERALLVARLNSLVRRAWQSALTTHQVQRLLFDLEKRTVTLQRETQQRTKAGEPTYQELSSEYINAQISWPESIQVKDFFIEGMDAFHVPGTRIQEVWFYVFPDGSSQEVILNFFDTADATEAEAGTRLSLVLNPFSASFKQYETFQHP